jgi:hypothetical protein
MSLQLEVLASELECSVLVNASIDGYSRPTDIVALWWMLCSWGSSSAVSIVTLERTDSAETMGLRHVIGYKNERNGGAFPCLAPGLQGAPET